MNPTLEKDLIHHLARVIVQFKTNQNHNVNMHQDNFASETLKQTQCSVLYGTKSDQVGSLVVLVVMASQHGQVTTNRFGHNVCYMSASWLHSSSYHNIHNRLQSSSVSLEKKLKV